MPGNHIHYKRSDLPMKEKAASRARALLSTGEEDIGETSIRVYYGEIGAAVPFVWESQPGTPKHPNFESGNDNIVPPLTPPPSYKTSYSIPCRNSPRLRIFSIFIPSMSRNTRSHVTPTSSLSSSNLDDPLSWSRTSSSTSFVSLSSPDEEIMSRSHKRSPLFCSTTRVNKFSFFNDDKLQNGDRFPTNSTKRCFRFKKHCCFVY